MAGVHWWFVMLAEQIPIHAEQGVMLMRFHRAEGVNGEDQATATKR